MVQKYLKTVSRGSGHWAVCPFHQDTQPSLSISESKNIFKCFVCDTGGNAINFVMKMEKCGYVDAVKKIGEILGIDVSSHLNQRQNRLYDLHRLNEYVADHYHKSLFSNTRDGRASLNYLEVGRRLKRETIIRHRIGYAPADDDLETVVARCRERLNIHPEAVVDSQLFNLQSGRKTRVPFFRDRIMFPILNGEGSFVGFSGRGENPKYLNLRTTRAFVKSQALFNVQFLEAGRPVYLFEGFIDLLKAGQELGCENGVACMGGVLDEQVFPLLKRYTGCMVLCLDNDEAGRRFTRQTGEKLVAGGFEVLVVNFLDSPCKDVDEMIDSGPEYIRRRMEEPIPFFLWLNMHLRPANITATRELVDSCLRIFAEEDGGLKPSVNLEYAQFMVRTLFGLFELNHPEQWPNIGPNVEERRTRLLLNLERSSISGMFRGPAEDLPAEEANPFFALGPYRRIAIRYSGLSDFVSDPSVERFDGEDWRYILPHRFRRDEVAGLLERLESPGRSRDGAAPVEEEHRAHVIPISNVRQFFNRYYSLFLEYLEAWAEDAFDQYTDPLQVRLRNKWEALDEVVAVKRRSASFVRQFRRAEAEDRAGKEGGS